jgi:hypothetical protein
VDDSEESPAGRNDSEESTAVINSEELSEGSCSEEQVDEVDDSEESPAGRNDSEESTAVINSEEFIAYHMDKKDSEKNDLVQEKEKCIRVDEIVLVGGYTRIPKVQSLVKEQEQEQEDLKMYNQKENDYYKKREEVEAEHLNFLTKYKMVPEELVECKILEPEKLIRNKNEKEIMSD